MMKIKNKPISTMMAIALSLCFLFSTCIYAESQNDSETSYYTIADVCFSFPKKWETTFSGLGITIYPEKIMDVPTAMIALEEMPIENEAEGKEYLSLFEKYMEEVYGAKDVDMKKVDFHGLNATEFNFAFQIDEEQDYILHGLAFVNKNELGSLTCITIKDVDYEHDYYNEMIETTETLQNDVEFEMGNETNSNTNEDLTKEYEEQQSDLFGNNENEKDMKEEETTTKEDDGLFDGLFGKEQEEDEYSNFEFTPTTLYDQDGFSIEVTDCEVGRDSYDFKIFINNETDKNLNVTARAYAVNGLMIGNNIYDMYANVAKGKKANAKISIDKSFLKENGFDTIGRMDILFWAYDDDSSMKDFDTSQCTFYVNPEGIDEEYLSIGETIYESNGMRVDMLDMDDRSCTILVDNQTGEYLDFDIDNVTVNDYTLPEMEYGDYENYGVIVFDECKSIVKITPSEDFLKENGIDDVETIDFSMTVRPKEDNFEEYATDLIHCEIKN